MDYQFWGYITHIHHIHIIISQCFDCVHRKPACFPKEKQREESRQDETDLQLIILHENNKRLSTKTFKDVPALNLCFFDAAILMG
jgi:hypothetical protein